MSDKVQGWVWDQELPAPRKLILLWLAGRATDNGVAFPGQREIREHTGLCERMVRYHLRWLASDQDDDGRAKTPLLVIVERRVSGTRNTSNVYVLRVPWAQPAGVRRDLAELKHVPGDALTQVGAMECPHLSPSLGPGGSRLQGRIVTRELSPEQRPPAPHRSRCSSRGVKGRWRRGGRSP